LETGPAIFNTPPPVVAGATELDTGEGLQQLGDVPQFDITPHELTIHDVPSIEIPDALRQMDELEFPAVPATDVTIDLPASPVLYQSQQVTAPDIELQRFAPELPESAVGVLEDTFDDVLTKALKDGKLDEQSRQLASLINELSSPETLERSQILTPHKIVLAQINEDIETRHEEEMAKALSYWASQGITMPHGALTARRNELERQRSRELAKARRDIYGKVIEQYNANFIKLREMSISLLQFQLELASKIMEVGVAVARANMDYLIAVHNSEIALYELNIKIYVAQTQVYEAEIKHALGKIEVFKTQVDAEKVKTDANDARIRQYEAQISAELRKVDVLRARVDTYRAGIEAELGKVEAYRGEVEGYSARLGTVASRAELETNVYRAKVQGEDIKARVYQSQVGAFDSRVNAFGKQVDAEAEKIRARNEVARAEREQHTAEVQAWATGVQADVSRIQAAADNYRARIEAYRAELGKAEVQERFRALGLEKELEKARLSVETQAGDVERALRVLQSASALQLQQLSDSTKVNAQLAAASMASLNLSATLSGSDSFSAGSSTSCTTTYSGVVS